VAVLTTDLLIEGIRRDAVFSWLGEAWSHGPILEGAFDACRKLGPDSWEVDIKAGPRTRTLTWQFDRTDDSHGGRRIYVRTTGKRFRGTMSFSLRTMKPSTNTLVTLHYDFDPGGILGGVALAAGLEDALTAGMRKVLTNLERELRKK